MSPSGLMQRGLPMVTSLNLDLALMAKPKSPRRKRGPLRKILETLTSLCMIPNSDRQESAQRRESSILWMVRRGRGELERRWSQRLPPSQRSETMQQLLMLKWMSRHEMMEGCRTYLRIATQHSSRRLAILLLTSPTRIFLTATIFPEGVCVPLQTLLKLPSPILLVKLKIQFYIFFRSCRGCEDSDSMLNFLQNALLIIDISQQLMIRNFHSNTLLQFPSLFPPPSEPQNPLFYFLSSVFSSQVLLVQGQYKLQCFFQIQKTALASIKMRNSMRERIFRSVRPPGGNLLRQISILQYLTTECKMATKPIQLIYFDENKRIVVNQQAINWLNQVNQDRHIAIVTVVGKYRTGKSYILNRVLLNQNNGFEVGPTINACTKGLWVWPQLISHPTDPTMQFMVMDTEGLGSLQQGEEVDTKIFLIAMLLSSYFIYNSLTSIDEKAIQSLSLVVNLSKLLSKGNEKDRKNILNSFPSFMWLVRDFTLQMVDKNNKPIRPIDYLNNALQFQEGNSDLTIRKNSVRKQLINFFKDRDCFTLIRPVDDQSKLQNMAKLQDSELRPQFLEKIGQFRAKVLGNMKKKMFKGKPCSPAMFVELCQYFCASINQGGLPEIQNNWDLVCKAESNRLEKRYLEEFRVFLKKNSEKKAETVDMKIFETEANEIVVRLLKNFQKNALGDKIQKKKVLKETMIGEYQRLKKKISTSKNQALDQKLNSINEDMYSMINQNEINSIFQICEKYDGVIEKESKGASDQTSHYLYKKCFEGLKTNCFTLFANLIQSNKNQKETLEQKLVSCIEAMNRMKEEQAQKLREAEAGYRQLSKQKVESELRAKEENQDLKRRLQKIQAKRNNENVNLCN